LARTREFATPIATFSIHHIQPALYQGFEIVGPKHIRLAKMEKALFDFYYFKSTKTRLFSALPELEIPPEFNWPEFHRYLDQVPSAAKKATIQKEIKGLGVESLRHM
jgi:hypothetical protein